MANDEARCVASYLIKQRGIEAYGTALGHMQRLTACGNLDLAVFWQEIAGEIAIAEAQQQERPDTGLEVTPG